MTVPHCDAVPVIRGESHLTFVKRIGKGKAMPDSKHFRWHSNFGTEAEVERAKTNATVADNQPAANDADGWQHYRRWISKAPAPRSRRQNIDPALYSWRGYREWTDQVRRNWSKDPTEDTE